jgi:dihydrofolate reductase
MRRVVVYELVSADGVAERPETFLFDFDEVMYDNLADVIGRQDTVLLGRAMYNEWSEYWPTSDDQPFADFINNVPKFIATSSPLGTPWNNASVIEGPVSDFVRELKSGDGGDIGVHGSLRLAQSLLAAGLVDELRLLIAPCVAGMGRHLLASPDAFRRLRTTSCTTAPTGALLVSYDVDNSARNEA